MESKLLMLGEKTLEKIYAYTPLKSLILDGKYTLGTDITEEEIIAMKRDINLLREQFYDF